MIRSSTMTAAAMALAVVMAPATAATVTAARGVTVVVQKDRIDDVVRGEAWQGASRATRRAADLRVVTVGDSPRGAKYLRFAWRTEGVQKRQAGIARTYSTFGTTPETSTPVEVRLVQVGMRGPEALLFVDGDTSGCLYASGAPPIRFTATTVSVDIRRSCLKSATDAIGIVLDDATASIARGGASRDRVIGTDRVRFRRDPQKNF